MCTKGCNALNGCGAQLVSSQSESESLLRYCDISRLPDGVGGMALSERLPS
jgi:hypothetical protein